MAKKKKKDLYNVVNIVIKKKLADDTPQIYAEFEAEEIVLDGVRTLFAEEANFRQDATVREHPEIKEMRDMLERENLKTKEDKLAVVRKAIVAEEKKIAKARNKSAEELTEEEKEALEKIEGDKKKNVTGRLNILDEQARLIKLKICQNVVKNDSRGSYVIFLPDGRRQYEYMYNDGLLYPIKHLVIENCMFPNEGSMVRIHTSWVNRLAEDLLDTKFDHWGKIWMAIMIIATVLMFIGGTIWNINIAKQAREMPEECSTAMIAVSKEVADIARSVNVRIPEPDNKNSTSIVREVQET